MSVKDVIKKSVVASFVDSRLTVDEIISLLLLSLVIGFFIFMIYRITSRSDFYSKAFNTSLMLMPVITATIIVTIQASVVVSLGMVGALSIVRFRTALKNPLDLIYMFWSISVGIVVGAGLPTIAIAMSVIVAVVLLVVTYIPVNKGRILLSVSTVGDIKPIEEALSKYAKVPKCKSKSFNGKQTVLLYEIKNKKVDELFEELKQMDGVAAVSVVANGVD